MAPTIPVLFAGGAAGRWRVTGMSAVRGAPLPPVIAVDIDPQDAKGASWMLRGVAGHQRYVTRQERETLVAVSAGLGRAEASRAALIPIRKTDAWWELAQDERRAIFEERSRHIADTLRFLPGVARRLYQSRELGEPFDFLTWFEFAPEHAPAFDECVQLLRSTEEWRWVEREVDIRLERVLT